MKFFLFHADLNSANTNMMYVTIFPNTVVLKSYFTTYLVDLLTNL